MFSAISQPLPIAAEYAAFLSASHFRDGLRHAAATTMYYAFTAALSISPFFQAMMPLSRCRFFDYAAAIAAAAISPPDEAAAFAISRFSQLPRRRQPLSPPDAAIFSCAAISPPFYASAAFCFAFCRFRFRRRHIFFARCCSSALAAELH